MPQHPHRPTRGPAHPRSAPAGRLPVVSGSDSVVTGEERGAHRLFVGGGGHRRNTLPSGPPGPATVRRCVPRSEGRVAANICVFLIFTGDNTRGIESEPAAEWPEAKLIQIYIIPLVTVHTVFSEATILHIDDESSFTDLMKVFLKRNKHGFCVETATSAEEGLATLADHPPDRIVSDYNMPGMDGLEFLRTVRKGHPDLPFRLFTREGAKLLPVRLSPRR